MATLVSHVWKPSKARTISLDSFIPVPRGTLATSPAPLNWPSKDPADILDYQINIEPALVGNEGDTISGVDVDIEPSQPGDLSLDNTAADGYNIILWLSGGQASVTYNVTIKVSMATGRILQRTVLLPVLALSTPSVPVNSIQSTTGDPLTDENGNPILYA